MMNHLRLRLQKHIANIKLFTVGKYVRYIKKPSLPVSENNKVWIHVGCGSAVDKRYINMDTRPGSHVHIVDSIINIHKHIAPNKVDIVYACHIFEHIPYAQLDETVKKVHSILKKGGVLRISVPNFATLIDMYQEKKSIEDILPPLMGGQDYTGNFHFTVFDESFLTDVLKKGGFVKIQEWSPESSDEHTFDDWAGRTFPLYGKEWQISLNREAIK